MGEKTLVVLALVNEDLVKPRSEFDTSLDEYDEVKYFAERPDGIILKIAKEDFADKAALKKKIMDISPSCIFNRFEGFYDDSETEIEFAHILEETGIPFTGNSSQTLALCLDKWGAKKILERNGIQAPRGIFIDDIERIDTDGLCFPLFLKPCFEDGSAGIDDMSYVEDEEALISSAARKLEQFPKGLVAEEFISGKEYAIGVVGNFNYEVLGVSVLDYSSYNGKWSFLTFNSKWMSDTPEYEELMPSVDGHIDEETMKKLRDLADRTAKAFGCRGYFRIDTRERNGKIFVIDVNPNPDISRDSGFMKMAAKKGYTYEEMLELIIELAMEDDIE